MKRRQGFVSNSSSSSFVLFGCTIEEEKVNEMYAAKLVANMIEKWGTAEQVPPATDNKYGETSDEELFHDFVKDGDASIFEEQGSYEKAEYIGISYADEYIGYVAGFHPQWFKANPTKTWNDAIEVHTAELIALGLEESEICFDYYEEEIND
jgi:hypothetical protein